MLKLRINPLVAADLKEIRDYIAEVMQNMLQRRLKKFTVNLKIFKCFRG